VTADGQLHPLPAGDPVEPTGLLVSNSEHGSHAGENKPGPWRGGLKTLSLEHAWGACCARVEGAQHGGGTSWRLRLWQAWQCHVSVRWGVGDFDCSQDISLHCFCLKAGNLRVSVLSCIQLQAPLHSGHAMCLGS
jgi:hypothetical protein